MHTCLIIESHKKNGRVLVDILKQSKKFQEFALVESGNQALTLLESGKKFDLIFLDMDQIDKKDIENILKNNLVIFMAENEKHAIFAFDVEAVDYILRPFTKNRLSQAFEKFELRLKIRQHEKLNSDFLAIKGEKGNYLVERSQIIFIQASRKGTALMLENEKIESTLSLKQLQTLLGDNFVQIHKTYLVNKTFVAGKKYDEGGRYRILLKNKEPEFLISGRSYTKNLKLFNI